jgi:hypothetical protein
MIQKIKAGLYRMNITPPLDVPVVGSWRDEYMDGYLDELYVNALVLDDGKSEAALVSVDVCYIQEPIIRDLCEELHKACNIAADNITISATHTHKGPKLISSGRDYYTEYFMKCVVSCVKTARSVKQPVRIGAGKGENKNHVFNRRLKKPDGSIVMNWISLDELNDCANDGPVDPELYVLTIEDEEGKLLGFVINYGNHNNAVGENKFSGDISGHIGTLLRRLYGEEVIILFLLRNCGNVNWIDIEDKDQRKDPELYKKIAAGLTGTILEILPFIEYPRIDSIEVESKIIKTFERETLKTDEEGYSPDGKKRKEADMFSHVHNDELNRRDPYDLDVHVVRIGDEIALATNPGEMFVEYTQRIMCGTPFRYQFVTEQTNGRAGYIPTKEAFSEGGYEVHKPANRLEMDIGDKIVEATVEMLKKTKMNC